MTLTAFLCVVFFIYGSLAAPSTKITPCYKNAAANNQTQNVVKVGLYIESQCPGCKDYIDTQLTPTYDELGDYIDLIIVPYGNAQYKVIPGPPEDYSFKCQHGPNECLVNQLMCCGIQRLNNNPHKYEPYIQCLDSTRFQSEDEKKCNKAAGLDDDDVFTCANSTEGRQLHYQAALLTDALNPPHQYTPWVTINDAHGKDAEEAGFNLKKVVCKDLDPKPDPCNK